MSSAFAPLTGAVDNGKSYNLEKVLRSNIVYSDYYRELCKISDFYELVDEVYNEVDHVEPWMSGNARGPSTAFCLLYRLCVMELDDDQISHLVRHRDSPYIRALGFLYVRYVVDHRSVPRWFEPHLADDEPIAPSPGGREISLGAFVRDLALDQYYFETIFPRIPEVTRRALREKIVALGFPGEPAGCGGLGGSRRGESDGRQGPKSVKAALSVNLGQRAPHVQALERGRGLDPTSRGPGPRDRDRSRDRDRRGSDRDRRGHHHHHHHRRDGRERDAYRSRGGGEHRRPEDPSSSRDARGGDGDGGRWDRDGDSRDGDAYSRDAYSRDRGGGGGGGYHPYRRREDRGGEGRRRSRSASRDRERRRSRSRSRDRDGRRDESR